MNLLAKKDLPDLYGPAMAIITIFFFCYSSRNDMASVDTENIPSSVTSMNGIALPPSVLLLEDYIFYY